MGSSGTPVQREVSFKEGLSFGLAHPYPRIIGLLYCCESLPASLSKLFHIALQASHYRLAATDPRAKPQPIGLTGTPCRPLRSFRCHNFSAPLSKLFPLARKAPHYCVATTNAGTKLHAIRLTGTPRRPFCSLSERGSGQPCKRKTHGP